MNNGKFTYGDLLEIFGEDTKIELIDGVITEVHKSKDIEDFVFEKLPSLKGKKNVNIGFAQQKVFLR